jgi:hypothetical protein
MRPADSFSTLSIHGLCMLSHTLLIGAMKVWNFSVTLCWASPARWGTPRVLAAAAWTKVRRFICEVSGELEGCRS